jgi:hypothetical protein
MRDWGEKVPFFLKNTTNFVDIGYIHNWEKYPNYAMSFWLSTAWDQSAKDNVASAMALQISCRL